MAQEVNKHWHSEALRVRWPQLSIQMQMGNIGSEVSRCLMWKDKDESRFWGALARGLELFEFSIDAAAEYEKTHPKGRLMELLAAREEFLDYMVGGNTWGTDPKKLQEYYDQFALMTVRDENIDK